MRDVFVVGDVEVEAALVRRRDGMRLLRGNDEIPVALEPEGGGFALRVGGETRQVFVATQGGETFVHLDGETYVVAWEDALSRLAHAGAAGQADVAVAPMPGVVISIAVEPGRAVTRGTALMVIESMKLQTTISAGRDGVVRDVHVAVDQAFDRGAVLVTLEAEDV